MASHLTEAFPIIIENMSFSYDDITNNISDITLSIPPGKIIAIMGGSGSGKTTLLKLISGQITPNTGSIKIFNQNLKLLSRKEIFNLRKRIGMLFQFGALFTDMTVFENIAFSLIEHTKLPQDFIHDIVAMKLKAVGLFGTQNLFPNELSGGMSRRVALARAMVLDPELMLYDEPFTGLDPISLNVTSMLIKKLNDTLKQTSILVTHDIQTSLKIADYIYFMQNGKIIASGTPNEVSMSQDSTIQQFMRGEFNGPINYEYPTKLNYNNYLGLNVE